MTEFKRSFRAPTKRVFAMSTTEDEPEVRNLILFGLLAACVAKEFFSIWAVIS